MIRIRLAQEADLPALHGLLGELAAFEGGGVSASLDDLRRDGFGAQPLFQALLAEDDGRIMGLLVFFPTYSSWRGKPGVMIHDLYVRPEGRGRGIGQALVAELMAIAQARGCCRMDVNVLEWNERARAFYAALGMAPTEGWMTYRLEVK